MNRRAEAEPLRDRTNDLLASLRAELGVEPELANSSGARLEVASGTWAPTLDDDSTPPGTQRHTAVWTGEEMLIWGGRPEISSSLRVYYTDTRPTADPDELQRKSSQIRPHPVTNRAIA